VLIYTARHLKVILKTG